MCETVFQISTSNRNNAKSECIVISTETQYRVVSNINLQQSFPDISVTIQCKTRAHIPQNTEWITSVGSDAPSMFKKPSFSDVLLLSCGVIPDQHQKLFSQGGRVGKKKSKDVPAVTSSKSLLAALSNGQFCLMSKLCTSSVSSVFFGLCCVRMWRNPTSPPTFIWIVCLSPLTHTKAVILFRRKGNSKQQNSRSRWTSCTQHFYQQLCSSNFVRTCWCE